MEPIYWAYVLSWGLIWMVIGGTIGDSKGRMGSGIVWSMLLGPLGVVIVLLLPNLKQQAEAKQATCTCGTQNEPGARFCANCGASLQPAVCTNCGEDLKPGARFCAGCGTPAKEA